MKQALSARTVNLNKETFDLLELVSEHLIEQLCFTPTLGQVIKHVLSKAYPDVQMTVTKLLPMSSDRQQSLLN
jgi:hypothetical protein